MLSTSEMIKPLLNLNSICNFMGRVSLGETMRFPLTDISSKLVKKDFHFDIPQMNRLLLKNYQWFDTTHDNFFELKIVC